MKKTLYIFLGFLLGAPLLAGAVTTFNSNQVGSSPTNNYILQTDGTVSTWVATSSIKFFSLTTIGSSGAATYSGGTLNIPQYSGGGASGGLATTTPWTPLNLVQVVDNGTVTSLATSSLKLTTSSFASPNISQWTNNSGYFTSYDAWTHPFAGASATTSVILAASASTTGTIEAGGAGGVEAYAMSSGVGTLGFNSLGYVAGVSGYGALFQLAPSTGQFTAFLESNATAGAAHSHTQVFDWLSDGIFTTNQGFISQASSTIGAGTQATGLTINGGATTTQYLNVQGSTLGTSTFTGNVDVKGNLENDTISNAIVVDSTGGTLIAYTGTSCTNQFVRSLSALGAATCATVANTDLANSSLTVNGTSIALGASGTITAASSTLLANNNTWTGGNVFGNATTTNLFSTTASSTNLFSAISSFGTITNQSVKSALVLNSSGGLEGAYGGASACSSNNFVTTISAVGGTTCGTAAISGINLGGTLGALTALNTTLTFSGSYDGSTARTVALNLATGNVWTAASSTFAGGLTALTATTTSATTTNFAITAVKSALDLNDSAGVVTAYTGSAPCTNQVALSINASGVISCTSVSNAMLSNSSITINSTAIALGASGTITAASSTLLGDTNTFTGLNTFSRNGQALAISPVTNTNGIYNITSNVGGNMYWGVDSSGGQAFITGTTPYSTVLGNATSTSMFFATANTIRQTITSAGNVGFGTTTPLYVLSVSTSTASSPTTGLFGVGSTTGNGVTKALFEIFGNGFVGIGSSTPQVTLSIGNGVASSSVLIAEYPFGGVTMVVNGVSITTIATSTAYTFGPTLPSNHVVWPIGTSATTFTLCMLPGQTLTVRVVNPAAGTAGAITWATCSGEEINWPSGTIPTQTTTAKKYDIWSFIASGDYSPATSTPQTTISGAQNAAF